MHYKNKLQMNAFGKAFINVYWIVRIQANCVRFNMTADDVQSCEQDLLGVYALGTL